jgi:hypothetical protein
LHGGAKGIGRPIKHGAYSKFLREKCKDLAPYVDLVEAADAEAGGVTLAGETLAMRARLAQELAEDAPPLDLATLATAARGLVATDKALEQLVPAYVAMEHLRETLRVVRSNTDTETFEAITVELVRRGLVSRAPDL